MIMAGNVLLTLPVVLIFLAFQQYFVEGMATLRAKPVLRRQASHA